jgi:hypothetical protein
MHRRAAGKVRDPSASVPSLPSRASVKKSLLDNPCKSGKFDEGFECSQFVHVRYAPIVVKNPSISTLILNRQRVFFPAAVVD